MTPEMIVAAFETLAERLTVLERKVADLTGTETPAPPVVVAPLPPQPPEVEFNTSGVLVRPAPTIAGSPPYTARIEAIIPPHPQAWTSPITGHTLVYPVAGEGLMGYAMRVSRQANPGVEPPPYGKAGGLLLSPQQQMGEGFVVDDRRTWPACVDRWYNNPDLKSEAEWAAHYGKP